MDRAKIIKTDIKTINDETMNELLSKKKKVIDKTNNSTYLTYLYVGSGGDGIIYSIHVNDEPLKLAIKVYKRVNIDITIKEFYIMGILKELNEYNLNDLNILNIVEMYDYSIIRSNPIMLMEELDGDMKTWLQLMMKTDMTQEELDLMWKSMIFQVVHGFGILNRLNILHNDAKPKNILFEKYDHRKRLNYRIKTGSGIKEYSFKTNYVFKIADFGNAQILGSTGNKISDEEIKEKIKNRSDLYELSRILYRILVDHAISDYNIEDIKELIKVDEKFKSYYEEKQEELLELDKYPDKIKNRFFLKGLLYYAIENDIISKKDIINKHSLRFPSQDVLTIMDMLCDTKYDIKDIYNKLVH